MFRKKKEKKKAIIDPVEMIKFYKMLLKMKARRPQFDVDRIMLKLYSDSFSNFIN